MEFEIFKIPKPEVIIFLNVPYNISKKLLKIKDERGYLKNTENDKVEKSRKYQENSYRQSLKLIKEHNNWIEINCVKNNKLLSIKDINNSIWKKIETFIYEK